MATSPHRDGIPPERHFEFDVAEALQAAHDNLGSCPDECWDGDADSWDWNHHADAILATPEMQAIRCALADYLSAYEDVSPIDTAELFGLPVSVVEWVFGDGVAT